MFEDTLRVVATLTDRAPIEILPAELDDLFARLAATRDINAAGAIEDEIWGIWTSFPDPAAERAMSEAIAAIAGRNHPAALVLLDNLVRAQPLWPEAWNKRATLLFLMGRDGASVRDIRRTLLLEPRHFGALAGFAHICVRAGDHAAAAVACEAALRIHPYLPAVRVLLDRLGPFLSSTRH
jgi:hypothetical protein